MGNNCLRGAGRGSSDLGPSQLNILMKEIDNLVSLLIQVDEGSEPMDTLTAQKQKVLDLLPVKPDDGRDGGTYPLHKLLSCRPLTKTEIPLDVLEMLIESGFNVNSRDYNKISLQTIIKHTCLNLAIRNDHFAAVRCLVQHGADCDITSCEYPSCEYECLGLRSTTPIAELARKANAPLYLFDLLATPNSLKHERNSVLPLAFAIKEGHTENALHLIKLGSPIKSRESGHMIHYYLHAYPTQYHDELFTHLIPSETIHILKGVDKVLQINKNESEDESEKKEENDSQNENEENDIKATPIKYQLLHRLFQYIIPKDHMCICFRKSFYFPELIDMMMNSENICWGQFQSLQRGYWWSLLLVNLGWSFTSTPQSIIPLLDDSPSQEDVQLANRIDDIWKTYRDACRVISLQNLCIQHTRRSMRDFSDESFMSLPVPNKLRKLLMYQHVAEIACEVLEMYK